MLCGHSFTQYTRNFRGEISLTLTDKNNPCFGDTYSHVGLKVKRDNVFLLVFPIGPPTVTSMERAWRELSIDMTVAGPTWKPVKTRHVVPFYLHPKMRIGVPKTGIIFIKVIISEFLPIKVIIVSETNCKFRERRQQCLGLHNMRTPCPWVVTKSNKRRAHQMWQYGDRKGSTQRTSATKLSRRIDWSGVQWFEPI